MCGICGLMNFDGSPVASEVLARMQAVIHHRGPDSQGIHLDETAGSEGGRPTIGLASTRLRVIDLSERARQPLSNEDDQLWIVFNGEIYNYRALAEQLESRGHRFKSQSDTEVILHLYEERGEACVEDLDGMFAFALWDRARGTMLLARDRTGKKPLFYSNDGHTLLFASEIKALLQHPTGPGDIDEQAIRPFLIFGYVPGPQTFYRGISQLPPGHTLLVNHRGEMRLRQYWDLAFPEARVAGSLNVDVSEAAERVRALVTNSVRKRLIADVPLGAFLSGGLDSAIVVGLMSRLSSRPVKTFTIGFRGASAYDETESARTVARQFATDHTEFLIEEEAADLIEPLIWYYDGPFKDSSAIPTFVLSRLARAQVTVVLNGDGGDELFAGYRRFWATLLAERIPRTAFRLATLLGRVPRVQDRRALLDRVARFVRTGTLPFYERFSEGFAAGDLDLDCLLKPELQRGSGRGVQGEYFAPYLDRVRTCSPLSRLLYLNFKTYLPDDLLVKMDRSTMAHALEARSPFLDHQLVEYVAGLPDGLKLSGTTTKVILRKAFADLVPSQTRSRGKMGFEVPMAAWLRTHLRKIVEDVLLQPRPRFGEYLDTAYVGSLARAHLEERADHGLLLWSLITLELWLEQLPSWRRRSG